MPQVIRRGGSPKIIDYTPTTGAVTGGDVVVLGNLTGLTTGIAFDDIANNTLGALEAGGGIYECINLDNAANYAKVYWADAANKVTTTATANAPFGFISSRGGGGVNSPCYVLHHPYV